MNFLEQLKISHFYAYFSKFKAYGQYYLEEISNRS